MATSRSSASTDSRRSLVLARAVDVCRPASSVSVLSQSTAAIPAASSAITTATKGARSRAVEVMVEGRCACATAIRCWRRWRRA